MGDPATLSKQPGNALCKVGKDQKSPLIQTGRGAGHRNTYFEILTWKQKEEITESSEVLLSLKN